MYIPKVGGKCMTTGILFLGPCNECVVLSRSPLALSHLLPWWLGVLPDGAQLKLCVRILQVWKKLPLQWFPKQLSASNDWLMRRVQVWPLQLETFWKNHPSIRISCETCHNPYCNCIMIQFIPLLSTASFIPLWAWSLKSLPRVPPAQCLHLKVCLPENATYNRHNEKIWQLRSFDSRSMLFLTSSTSSYMLVIKARSCHFLQLIERKYISEVSQEVLLEKISKNFHCGHI